MFVQKKSSKRRERNFEKDIPDKYFMHSMSTFWSCSLITTNAGEFVVSFIGREMLHLWLVIGFLLCGGSYAKESSNLDQNQWSDIMNELKALRKEIEENRKRINYQESELKAVKLELEETKRYCHSGPVPTNEKFKSEEVEVFSQVKNSINRSREQSKISKLSLNHFMYQLDEINRLTLYC